MRPQPMIVVRDVAAASKWFQDILGISSGHGGDEYEMLMDSDEMVAQLHRWDAHEHPHLGDAADPSRGNGVLLWFATDDGLDRFDREGGRVIRYRSDSGQSNTPSRNEVTTIHQDQAGTLWIGTRGGLSRFDPEFNSFKKSASSSWTSRSES